MKIEELINKVCTLSCTKEDLVLDYSSIKNLELKDSKCSFIKYYNLNTILDAFNKYINKEWNIETLVNWCSIYTGIIEGDFLVNSKINFKGVERLIYDLITTELDIFPGMYANEIGYLDEKPEILNKLKFYDSLWQQRKDLKAFTIERDLDPNAISVLTVLINEKTKEYMTVSSIEDIIFDESIHRVNINELKQLMLKLEKDKYKQVHKVEVYIEDGT